MSILQAVSRGIAVTFACLCVGTTLLQSGCLYVLWSKGALTPQKVQRYTAVLYGLDLTDIPVAETAAGDAEVAEELLTRDEVVQRRVEQSELLGDRETAIRAGSIDARDKFGRVRFDNSFFEQAKVEFDAYLKNQEETARQEAIQEVEQTLAVLPPRQSKELIVRMLADRDVDPEDDVMDDIVTILEAMPDSKLKKIFAEFKQQDDLDQLFEIMIAIGDIDIR